MIKFRELQISYLMQIIVIIYNLNFKGNTEIASTESKLFCGFKSFLTFHCPSAFLSPCKLLQIGFLYKYILPPGHRT